MESLGRINMFNLEFYRGKKVLITGHTGFKGTWLSKILINSGADVVGYSLPAPTEPSLYNMLQIEQCMKSITGDVRDYNKLKRVFDEEKPEIVFHLAAQPLVKESYRDPLTTYETNVMGTVNILECARTAGCVKSILNVTTDKVYLNREWNWGYRENEELDGYDPYSNSKSCSELVTHCYKNSFLDETHIATSTARAGNVIGGGDFSENRIIPDCVRAAQNQEKMLIRNPHSIRPYQHVLEPIYVYLMIAARQYEDIKYAGYYNVGPDEQDCVETGRLVELFGEKWKDDFLWEVKQEENAPHEANFLKLDCSMLKATFGWKPIWNIETAVDKTVEWSKCWMNNEDISECMDSQIEQFFSGEK